MKTEGETLQEYFDLKSNREVLNHLVESEHYTLELWADRVNILPETLLDTIEHSMNHEARYKSITKDKYSTSRVGELALERGVTINVLFK